MKKEREPRPHPLLTLDNMTKHACERLFLNGEYSPTLILQMAGRVARLPLPDMPAVLVERQDYLSHLGWLVAEKQEKDRLDDLFFISEAWLANTDEGLVIENPSEAEQRREILLIAQMKINAGKMKKNMAIYTLHRKETGKLSYASEYRGKTDVNKYVTAVLTSFLVGYALEMASRRDNKPNT